MKHQQLKNLISVFAVVATVLWLGACVTQTSNVADTNMDGALLAAGFKSRPAVTPAQRQQLRALPDNRFTRVKQGSQTYYLYPDKNQGRLFAGNEWAYRGFVNNAKNNELRKQGAFVFETDPSDPANPRPIVIWHGWSPFPEWR